MRGLGDCKFERANEKWALQRRRRLVDRVRGDMGARRDVADAGDRQLHRPHAGDRALGLVHRQLAAATQEWRRTQFDTPLPLKPSFCTLSMLFTDWNRSGTPSLRVSNDREYYLGGTGAALARRSRQAACAVHCQGRLEAA